MNDRNDPVSLDYAVPGLGNRQSLLSRLPIWATPALTLGLLIFFTIGYEWLSRGQSTFIKPENLLNVLRQWSDRGIIALGMALVITLGGIDLSVGSLLAWLGGIGILLVNALMAHGVPEPIAVFAGFGLILFAGTGAGLLNGLLITLGRLAPFIATLGALAAYRSLALFHVDGGEYRSSSQSWFPAIGAGGIPIPGTNLAPEHLARVPLLIPWQVLILLVLTFITWAILNRMRLGRYIQAIGANEQAAIYSGIAVNRVKLWTYGLLGLFTGIAAMLLASRQNSISSAQSGLLYELDVIAAVVIGGTRLRGGSGTIAGTIIGVLILGVIGNMLNLLQVSTYLQGLVKGSIIIGAALLQRGQRR